jgi:hypothetical protein
MPLYDFQTESGEIIEAHFAMVNAPSIGETIEIDGQPATRLVSKHHAQVHGIEPFVSRTLPKNDPRAPRHDKEGRAMFATQREVTEYLAKTEGQFGYDK